MRATDRKRPPGKKQREAEGRWKEKQGAGAGQGGPRGAGTPGFGNYSYVAQNAPDSAGAESVVAFNADCVSFLKNDGAVDITIAFDTPAGPASVTRKPITVKAGEVYANALPVRTANIASKSTGAVSAFRILGHF